VSVLVFMEPGDPSRQAVTLARSFGGPVHAVESSAVEPFAPDALAAILHQAVIDLSPTAVVAAASDRGNDVMARLAARLDLPLAANCVAATPGNPLAVTRQRWGGSLLEEALVHSELPLITVAPHVFPVDGGEAPLPVDAASDLDPKLKVVHVVEHVEPPGGGVSLAEAKVVVSGGRGVGSKEGFAIIEELAALLGGRVGCSRVVTSAGWRPHSDQVGQTGTKISPDLYIACGISGATQHMAGCKGAKRLLAINPDAEAPILASADYAVIGDLHTVVPAINAAIRKARGT